MDYPTDSTALERERHGTLVSAPSKSVEEVVIPVLREEVEIHKEVRKTGTVRVRKTVRELEEAVHESLSSDTVEVQRVPVNLLVDSPPPVRTEGDVTIISVVKEELVVRKQWRVVEEWRVTRRESISDYHENVTVCAEEVTVERIDPENVETKTKDVQG